MKLVEYLEIISSSAFKKTETGKEVNKAIKTPQYKSMLKKVLDVFFKRPGSKIYSRSIIVPLGKYSETEFNRKNNFTSIDRKIINYIGSIGYNINIDLYTLGKAINEKGKEISIVNLLREIRNYDVDKLRESLNSEKIKDNEAAKNTLNKKIDAKEKFRETYLAYYEKKNNLKKTSISIDKQDDLEEQKKDIGEQDQKKIFDAAQYIVYTWVPAKIAQMSTQTGWSSCMDIFRGGNRFYVPNLIQKGTFIAWLTKKDDTFRLKTPTARVLIKPFMITKGRKEHINRVVWYPSTLYGTPPPQFLSEVKKFILEKQGYNEENITEDTHLELLNEIYRDNNAEASEIIIYAKKTKDRIDPSQKISNLIFKGNNLSTEKEIKEIIDILKKIKNPEVFRKTLDNFVDQFEDRHRARRRRLSIHQHKKWLIKNDSSRRI